MIMRNPEIENKTYEFDINEFISWCKQYGAEVRKGSGKILIDDEAVNVADIIEEKLTIAKEKFNIDLPED